MLFIQRRLIVTTLLASVLSSTTTQSQNATTSGSTADGKMREAVINAVLAFRPDLQGDSLKIARCRLAAAPTDSVENWILPRLRVLLVQPFKSETGAMACSVMVFQRPGTKVLWLDSMVEVRRRGGIPLGPIPGLSFEISFQWLRGTDYRRFEQYELRPVNPAGTEWRVVHYELTGEEWMEPWGGAFTAPSKH
jgi:hypothetical protein